MSKFKLLQLTLITGTLVVLAGCSSAPTDDSATSGEMSTTEETVSTDDEMAEGSSGSQQTTTEMMPMDEPMAEEESSGTGTMMPMDEPMAEEPTVPAAPMPEETTVYFAFDSFALNAETRQVLDQHVAYLRENQDTTVVLEGHTDERGSAEYNLALGENRAQSVQDYMNLRGIENRQMYTTSFGEMNPAVDESNEEAWAQNRRVEIQYQN